MDHVLAYWIKKYNNIICHEDHNLKVAPYSFTAACLCMFVCTHNKMTVFIPRYFMTSAKPKKKKLAADSLAFFFGEFSETYPMLSFYYC